MYDQRAGLQSSACAKKTKKTSLILGEIERNQYKIWMDFIILFVLRRICLMQCSVDHYLQIIAWVSPTLKPTVNCEYLPPKKRWFFHSSLLCSFSSDYKTSWLYPIQLHCVLVLLFFNKCLAHYLWSIPKDMWGNDIFFFKVSSGIKHCREPRQRAILPSKVML